MTCPDSHYCPTCQVHLEGRYTEVTETGLLYDSYQPCGHETLRGWDDLAPEEQQMVEDAIALLDAVLGTEEHKVSAEELMDHPDLAALSAELESIWKEER